jgi:hypothetical protein
MTKNKCWRNRNKDNDELNGINDGFVKVAAVKLEDNKCMTAVSTRKFASPTEHIFNAKTILILCLLSTLLCHA